MAIDLDDPIALLLSASNAFSRAGIEAAAYGGLTLGMYGEVRETRDADLAAAGIDTELARHALDEIGATPPRVPSRVGRRPTCGSRSAATAR